MRHVIRAKSPRKPLAPKVPVPLEREVQDEIVKLLTALGCKVLQTSVRKGAGKDGHSGGGQDRGIPDLLISLPPGLFLGIEVKRPKGWKYASDEQRQGHELGRFWVVTSPGEAAWALWFGVPDGHPMLQRVLNVAIQYPEERQTIKVLNPLTNPIWGKTLDGYPTWVVEE